MTSQGTLGGICLTNAVDGDDGMDVSHVYARSSRANHSCRPNAVVAIDGVRHARQLYAVREILPNEEICISYAEDYEAPKHAVIREQLHGLAEALGLHAEALLLGLFREQVFAKWGFWCTCPRCGPASTGADLALAQWHAY